MKISAKNITYLSIAFGLVIISQNQDTLTEVFSNKTSPAYEYKIPAGSIVNPDFLKIGVPICSKKIDYKRAPYQVFTVQDNKHSYITRYATAKMPMPSLGEVSGVCKL